MMDEDIVERLRHRRQVYNGLGTFRDEQVNPDGPKAATEIETLRQRVAELEGVLRLMMDYNMAIEATRAALNSTKENPNVG